MELAGAWQRWRLEGLVLDGDKVAVEKLAFVRDHGIAEGLGAAAAKMLQRTADPSSTAGPEPGQLQRALEGAIRQGRTETVRSLLAAGVDANAGTEKDHRWRHPLVAAALAGSASVVELLLKAGADPNAQSPRGYTALMAAAEEGYGDVIGKLLAAGADPEVCGPFPPAIFAAVQGGHESALRALLTGGADPNARSANGSVNALMRAVFDGRARMAWTLLRAGADSTEKTSSGTTAALEARRNGQKLISLLFLLFRVFRRG